MMLEKVNQRNSFLTHSPEPETSGRDLLMQVKRLYEFNNSMFLCVKKITLKDFTYYF